MGEIKFKDYNQRRCFMDALISICKNRSPKKYLEIGVCAGESLRCVLENSNPHPKLITLCDDWTIHYNGYYFTSFDHIKKLLNNLKYKGKKELLNGNSHILLPRIQTKYDLILIDGDHSYNGALIDLIDTWLILEKGGLIVLDDVGNLDEPQVYECFKEFYKITRCKIVYINRDKKNGVVVITND